MAVTFFESLTHKAAPRREIARLSSINSRLPTLPTSSPIPDNFKMPSATAGYAPDLEKYLKSLRGQPLEAAVENLIS